MRLELAEQERARLAREHEAAKEFRIVSIAPVPPKSLFQKFKEMFK